MPKRNKKVASLSGSLLKQKASNPDVGFVLTSLDDVQKKPTGRHSGAIPGRANANESNPASERPTLHAVTLGESPQFEQSDRQVDAEGPKEPGAQQFSLVSKQESGNGMGNPAPQPSGANCAGVGGKVGHRDFLAALREGNLSWAEEIFGELTGLEPLRAKRVLYGPGGRNLTLACKALGFEQLQLVSILILTRKLGPNGASLNPHQLTDLVSYFSDMNEVTAESVLNQWRTEYIEVFGEQS